ncbi:MAG: hypothetical protein ACK514_18400 [Bacteroidota bacterium]|jgi:uncharacterized protein YaaQ|nr:hypothetical protein [Cytophagales bacterium]MCE2956291.1 hypothetical protein [Flammeovirgaceae bacterium]MCZ8070489.1 hypothetical protein [Cytophagales bacterium]
MKKLEKKKVESTKGGGCGKWVRRYNRAFRNGADQDTLDDIRNALDDCIYEKYYS